jgi:hypothetical protein
MATQRGTFGTAPSRRQPMPRRTRRPRPREKALPRRGTAGPMGDTIRAGGTVRAQFPERYTKGRLGGGRHPWIPMTCSDSRLVTESPCRWSMRHPWPALLASLAPHAPELEAEPLGDLDNLMQ